MGRLLKLGLAAMLGAATLLTSCTNRVDEEAILTAFEAVCDGTTDDCSNVRISCLVPAEVTPAEELNGISRKYAVRFEWVLARTVGTTLRHHFEDHQAAFVVGLTPDGWQVFQSGPNNSCAY